MYQDYIHAFEIVLCHNNVAVYSLKIGEEVMGLGDLHTAFADEHNRVVKLLLCPDESLIEPPWNNVKPVRVCLHRFLHISESHCIYSL